VKFMKNWGGAQAINVWEPLACVWKDDVKCILKKYGGLFGLNSADLE
jgi:hypothetical protein